MRTSRFVVAVSALWFVILGSAFAQGPYQFTPINPPCRLLDTRSGQPIQGGQTVPVPVQNQVCGALPGATAYSFNVTVVPHGTLSYLTLWPDNGGSQPVVSTLNSYDGRIKAVAAIIPAGNQDDGAVNVYATQTTDLILDVNGYFTPAPNQLAFYPLPACRLYDTRSTGYLHAQQTYDFAIMNACGVPTYAQAYSLNLTALPLNGQPLGFLTAWPAGGPLPATSTLNAPTGTATANAAIVQGGTNGQISVYAYNNTNLIIDINGYFAPPGENQNQLALYTLTPCRVFDTHHQNFTGSITVPVQSSDCNVPSNARSYVVNATVLPAGYLGYLTLWPVGLMPTVSTLNAWDGAVTSNLAIVGANTSGGTFMAYASNSTQMLIDIFGYMASAQLSIVTTSLPAGQTGQQYSQTLMGSGGVPPYTWSITSGSLPPGLTLVASTGAIAGIPTTTGAFNFTVQLTDSQNNQVSAPLSITITTGPLVILTTALPPGPQGVPYSATLEAGGGAPPYLWSITSGSLPNGLTLNANTGVISGTPTTTGTSNFTVQVTDSQQNTASAPLSIVVTPPVNDSALSGHYGFSFNGFSNGSPFVMAGAFDADGNGNILNGGVVDMNTGSGTPNGGSPVTGGTYAISGNGLGTLTLNATGLPALSFSIVVSQQGNGQLILNNADPQPRGSGAFYLQSPQDFIAPPAASYAIGTFGADASLNRYAKAGQFVVGSGGVVTSGTEDLNDNGTLGSRTYSGSFGVPNAGTGRGNVSLTFPNGLVNHYAYYVISTGQYVVIGTDPLSSTDPLTIASMLTQTGNYNESSLTGNSILELTGLAPNGGSPVPDAVIGLAAWSNGNGTFTLDENQGGNITQQQVSHGTYGVSSNGRVTTSGFGTDSPILYLSNTDQAFVLGQDASVRYGILEPQSAIPPYNNSSILGTYLGGTVNPAQSPIVDASGYFLADGNGNLSGMENTSGPSGPGTLPLSATYQVDSTGRAVVTGTPAGFMYVVSAKRVVLLPMGNAPALSVFNIGLTN